MEAYVLITTTVGRAGELAREITAVAGVTSAVTVTGAYDVIARAEVDSLADLHDRVLVQIADAGGVTRILPCPILRLYRFADDHGWPEEAEAAAS